MKTKRRGEAHRELPEGGVSYCGLARWRCEEKNGIFIFKENVNKNYLVKFILENYHPCEHCFDPLYLLALSDV